jgi:actin-binding protein IPP
MAWIEANIDARRRYIFDVLKFVRLPLVPSKLLDSYAAQCRDISIGVALDSVKKDLVLRKGSLVRLEQVRTTPICQYSSGQS